MVSLAFDKVVKSYGETKVIRGIDLEIGRGEFMALVGPSGCGKSTCLRMVAGLETVTSGDILIAGKRINDVPPKDRGIGMVFQSYALYPHMTVFDNMAFGLSVRKMNKTLIRHQVEMVAESLGLEDLLLRRPAELSGGQRQRVAMGRAIARQPDVYLFDEPLSNLDAALRVKMRGELASMHKRSKRTTTVYVTHDQIEAMTLADRICVLDGGVIQQVGTPDELFSSPVNIFVATFIGSPSMNIINNVLMRGDGNVSTASGMQLFLPERAGGLEVAAVGFRPNDVALFVAGGKESWEESGSPSFVGKVLSVERRGWESFAQIEVGEGAGSEQVTIRVEGERGLTMTPGETLECFVWSERLHLFNGKGERV